MSEWPFKERAAVVAMIHVGALPGTPAARASVGELADVAALEQLKDSVDGDLYVSGSGQLVRAMLADGLIDGLHLFVYPLTRGEGPRLFPDGAPPLKASLEATERYDNGVVYLHYRPEA